MMRKAQKTDLSFIYELEQKFIDVPWNKDNILYAINDENTIFLVLENIGYISCKVILDEGEINNIVVDEKFRHMGYGTQLLSSLIDELKKTNVEKVFLEVSQNNSGAYKLYSKLGFTKYNERKNYYGDGNNAICMIKNL